ncbi:arsenate reductase (glutaredoxin) [Eionea flava]
MLTIYHNPRCSKSRQTLSLIEESGHQPTIVRYLETPLSESDVRQLLSMLSLTARDIIRKGEDAYKEAGLADTTLSEDALINAIVKHPKLLERPIVSKGERAIIGRPPENVLALL